MQGAVNSKVASSILASAVLGFIRSNFGALTRRLNMVGKILALILLMCGLAACASSHQKNVGIGWGIYQAEYYDQEDKR